VKAQRDNENAQDRRPWRTGAAGTNQRGLDLRQGPPAGHVPYLPPQRPAPDGSGTEDDPPEKELISWKPR
jgi:hypothetical protein